MRVAGGIPLLVQLLDRGGQLAQYALWALAELEYGNPENEAVINQLLPTRQLAAAAPRPSASCGSTPGVRWEGTSLPLRNPNALVHGGPDTEAVVEQLPPGQPRASTWRATTPDVLWEGISLPFGTTDGLDTSMSA